MTCERLTVKYTHLEATVKQRAYALLLEMNMCGVFFPNNTKSKTTLADERPTGHLAKFEAQNELLKQHKKKPHHKYFCFLCFAF